LLYLTSAISQSRFDMTHKTSTIKQIYELLRLLHEAVDTLVDLGHSDRPYSTWYPPGVPMSDC
jgi:hypothetical protein